jgi:DNA-nicking Smr family endonuclease
VTKRPGDKCPDLHLFRQEMADVVPLKKKDTTVPGVSRPRPRRDALTVELRQENLLPAGEPSQINSEDGTSHRKNGVQLRLLQKLKRGRFRPVDQLDLHNMTVAQGQAALLEFINHSADQALVCVRIIHGKGMRSAGDPKLKLMTRQVLRDHPGVLAFTACKPADGGDGATDVLLRSA